MSKTNVNRDCVSVGVIEDNVPVKDSAFYDSSNPVFAPPRPKETRGTKTWKRKLIGWCLVLFLVVGGVMALYLVLRVKRVNVRVQADSRRESASARADPSPTNSENGLSAEAINIARQAIGADAAVVTNAASPSASVSASPSPAPYISRALSFTDNSPAYSHAGDASSSNLGSTSASASDPQQQPAQVSLASLPQAYANPTQTLFVEDPPQPLPNSQPPSLNQKLVRQKGLSNDLAKRVAPPVLPSFGTMLAVRTQGVIFSLRNNSYARLELARDSQGEGWFLPKGTLLIGRVNGSEYDRAFINIQGYIDTGTKRLVKMSGEVMGSDGGSGLQGKRIVFDRNRLKQTLSKVASSGLQMAGMMAGALTGRGTVVLNGAGSQLLNPITDDAGRIVNGGDVKRSFVKVEAGQPAYVMVADLPTESQGGNALGEEDLAASSFTDREVMELILFGTSEDVRAVLPLMNDEQKRLAIKSAGVEK